MATLEELREEIDKYDNDILKILEARMAIAKKIGEYKKKNNIAILQSDRWDEILNKRLEIAKKIAEILLWKRKI